MASQVFSGTGNFSYTNNTGQNVRVVINFAGWKNNNSGMNISWGNVSISDSGVISLGRNLAFSISNGTYGGGGFYGVSSNNMLAVGGGSSGVTIRSALPTEIMLANNQTFAITPSTNNSPDFIYNIVIIPENG